MKTSIISKNVLATFKADGKALRLQLACSVSQRAAIGEDPPPRFTVKQEVPQNLLESSCNPDLVAFGPLGPSVSKERTLEIHWKRVRLPIEVDEGKLGPIRKKDLLPVSSGIL